MVEIKGLIKVVRLVSILFSVCLITFLLYPGSLVAGGPLKSTLFAISPVLALIGAVSMSVVLVRE